MKKIFRTLHLWLSVPFGLLVSLICFSGAMLVFENEITEWSRPDLYQVKEIKAEPLPVEMLLERVAETLPDSVSVAGVSIPSEKGRTWQVNLSKPRRASVYIDPYTGEVKGKYERPAFFLTMFKLHRWLLDSMKPDGGIFWGKMIVGVSTLMFVLILLTGIIIWWPRTLQAMKNSLKITSRKGFRRFCYDFHVAGGLYALLFLLVMSLTGLTWSFAWYRTGFYKIFGVETRQGSGHAAHGQEKKGKEKSQAPYAHWEQVYRQLKNENPDCRQITISRGTANVSFDRLGNQRASDRYEFDPLSGEITNVSLYQNAEPSGKIRGWIYSVHVGSWGGMFTKILAFASALIGACLPLTGYYLWIRRKIGQRKRKCR